VIRRKRAKPLIAAVEGFAFGGGFEMVLACDLVVAARGASFALPEVKRGVLALYGGLFRAAHALPLNIARELALTGDALSAERAERLGLVNVLCEPGRAVDEALALAERICANSPVSARESLRVINESLEAATRSRGSSRRGGGDGAEVRGHARRRGGVSREAEAGVEGALRRQLPGFLHPNCAYSSPSRSRSVSGSARTREL